MAASSETRPWPETLRFSRADRALHIRYDDGAQYAIPFEMLRVESPSAEVQGHSEAERKLRYGKSGVIITGVDPVGNYAVRITFSDGHQTGFYSWVYLEKLGREHDELWAQYLAELEAAGKSR